MGPIAPTDVQPALQQHVNQSRFVHLETTTGAYAGQREGDDRTPVCAYIRNAKLLVTRATLAGSGPFRVGLQIEDGGWIYAEGLTDWEADDQGRLLLAGHDSHGRLTIALQLSPTKFSI